jgi:hypothetical protein
MNSFLKGTDSLHSHFYLKSEVEKIKPTVEAGEINYENNYFFFGIHFRFNEIDDDGFHMYDAIAQKMSLEEMIMACKELTLNYYLEAGYKESNDSYPVPKDKIIIRSGIDQVETKEEIEITEL